MRKTAQPKPFGFGIRFSTRDLVAAGPIAELVPQPLLFVGIHSGDGRRFRRLLAKGQHGFHRFLRGTAFSTAADARCFSEMSTPTKVRHDYELECLE